METQFLERIQWSKRTYALRMLLEFRRPPCIIHISEGYRGNNEIENLQPGLVVRIQSVFSERRVFARSVDGRVFSIPETFPIKFEVVKKSGKKRKAKRLDEILRNYRPPILVALDRKNSKWNFRNGRMIQSEDSLGTLILFKAYFEHFARVNQLINGVIDRRIFLIPLYLDLDVRLAEGYKNRSRSDYEILMRMLEAAVQSLDYNSYTGLNAILVFDPSVGSVHPLASSRIHSRTNSAPGGGGGVGGGGETSVGGGDTATRTPTDDRTTPTAKSSRPASGAGGGGGGSQCRDRSRNARGGRRRAKSEDFLLGSSILLDRRSDGRTPAPDVESKDGSGNSTSSSCDDDDDDDGVPGESNVGTGSRSLDRRKGRSAEELLMQSRSVDGGGEEAAVLDPLSGVGVGDSQARRRRRRRNRKEDKKRTASSASVDQPNYIRRRTDDVRIDDDVRARLRNSEDGADPNGRRNGRQERTFQGQALQGEGRRQGQTLDEVFDDDDVSVESVESACATPLPRSKTSRTRNKTEDSQAQEPRTKNNRLEANHVPEARTNNRYEANHVPETRTNNRYEDNRIIPEPLHSKRPQESETNENPSSSSNPKYHIHINIQSPQSPPTEQWPGHSKDLTVHSLVRGGTAVRPAPSRSPPPPVFKDEYGGPPGRTPPLLQLLGGSVARSSHRAPPVGDGIMGGRGDQQHRGRRQEAYSGGGTLPSRRSNLLHTFIDGGSERERNPSLRGFVSSVSCPGPSGLSHHVPVSGQRSNRLSSKVIQLEYAREPTIRDKDIGNLNHHLLHHHHRHHNHHHVAALPEIFDANNNSYHRSNFKEPRFGVNAKYRPDWHARSAVNAVDMPAARRDRFSQSVKATALDDDDEDREILRSQRAAVEQRMGRRWIIKNYNNSNNHHQPPPVKEPPGVRRNRLGATITVE